MTPFVRSAGSLLLWVAAFCVFPSNVGRADDRFIYADQEVPSHWSEPAASATLEGKQFHGFFGNQTVSLSLERLPRHHWVKVSFDLYIVGSWDGSSPVWGPDLWSLSVHGAQRLLFASFCGWGYAGNDEQSYPDDYPHAIHPAWTGVLARNVVDIKDSNPPKNGVYKVEVLFPHSDDRVVLDFAGAYQDPPVEQQAWGIGNVEVRALAKETVTDSDTLPGLWDKLADQDSVEANKALWEFVGAGAEAATFIREKVGQMADGVELSETEGLRLHRAHRIVRIIGGEGSSALCFRMDQLSIEYSRKYLDK